jgi:ATP-binding cassette subfamily B protein
VQLWNRGFLDNLRYGNGEAFVRPLAQVVDLAELRSLLEALPQGHQTALGEGGSLVSGGEGQRVRLGRALLRSGVRLAILDEPFRGLDRAQRSRLLARAREIWRGATLVCVTHDIDETRLFDRVLVVEGGRVVEDGGPGELAGRAGSRYRRLLEAEEAVRGVWADAGFDFARLENGRISETAPGARG